jgi:hypothetical protein
LPLQALKRSTLTKLAPTVVARASWDKVVLWNKHSTQYFINISLGTPPQPKMVRILPLAAACYAVSSIGREPHRLLP